MLLWRRIWSGCLTSETSRLQGQCRPIKTLHGHFGCATGGGSRGSCERHCALGEAPPKHLEALKRAGEPRFLRALETFGVTAPMSSLRSTAGVLSEELYVFAEALRFVCRACRAGLLPAELSGLAPTGSLVKLVTHLTAELQHGQAVPTLACMATAEHYLPAGLTASAPSSVLSGRVRPFRILFTSGVPRENLRVPLDILQAAAASLLFGVSTASLCPSVVSARGPSKPLATRSTHTLPVLRAVTRNVSGMNGIHRQQPQPSSGVIPPALAVRPSSSACSPTVTAALVLSFKPLLLNTPLVSSPSIPAAPPARIDAGVAQMGKPFVHPRPTEIVVVPVMEDTCQHTSIEEEVEAAATGSTRVSTSSTCVGQGKGEGINSMYLDGLELRQSPRGADVNRCPATGLNSSTTATAEARVRLVVESEEMDEMEVESMAGSLACVGEDARTCSPLANSRCAAVAAYSEAGGRGVAACEGSTDTVNLCTLCMKGVKRGCVTTEGFEQMDGELLVFPAETNGSWSELNSRPGWHAGGMPKSEGVTLNVCPRCGTAPRSLPTSVAAPCDFPRIDDNEFEMDATEWFHHVCTRTHTGDASPVGSFTRPDVRLQQKLDTKSLSQDRDHSCADASHLSPVSACSMMAAEVSLKHHAAEESLKHTTTNPFTRFVRRVKPSLHSKSCNAPSSPTNSIISDLTIDEELKPTLGNLLSSACWNYLNKDSKTPETITKPEYKVTVLEEAGNGKLGAIRVERVNVPPKAKGAKSLPRRIRKGLIRATNGMSHAARAVRNTVSGIYYSIPRIQLRKPRLDPEAMAAAHRRIMERHQKMYGRPQGGEDFKVEEWAFGDEDYEPPAFWH